MTLEQDVARHYTTGDLLARIDVALKESGVDPAKLVVDDLKPVDEFHTGGLEATLALLDQLEIDSNSHVVDLGCGLGGTARHIVHRYGARVTGVDLTPDFVTVAQELNRRVGYDQRITLHEGSVLDVPLTDGVADLVTMFHVGMNIADKNALFAEASRLLRPGGRFALFDVMLGASDADLVYPLPWSGIPETSRVEAPGVYRRAAHAAGLEQVSERDRSQFALDYFARLNRHVLAEGQPPLGIHLLMGDNAAEKLQNYRENVSKGVMAPTEMIFRKPLEVP
ncbi:class I SAM-dependent methyltransferase [Maribius pontilimi]|uniref:Class I SAM-dependent methyltransferase n=1 Tax=Palleronia pontilimi TaxID=1964209 RepID=A0A934IJT3_9RHOB|nr:class I SAM-dependent methyltransferase [Palleronia pontilimi]MBJ3764246.1 class I SAM-dependent methyltransferase [Palleronia pontilimi]